MSTTELRALSREARVLALPAIAHSLLQTLVFVVDRIMLGRHGEASLAAMQIGGALEWSIWSIFAAFEVGTVARVGFHVGAKDPARARKAATISLWLAVGIGSLVALCTPWVLALLPYASSKISSAALGEARAYLSVTLPSSPLVFVSITAVSILQAGGDTRTPLFVGVAANIVHIALNRALILGLGSHVPAMGARGAGISTAITFGLEAALALYVLRQRNRPVSLSKPEPDAPLPEGLGDEWRELVRIGSPAFLERLVYHIGFMAYALVVAQLGDAAMAANQALISVESVCFLSGDGFGVAASSLVARKVGAGQPNMAHRAAWIATRDAAVTLTCFGVLAWLLRDWILPNFSSEPHVLGLGKNTMFVLALAQPFMALGMVLAQGLRGAGNARASFGVTLACGLFVRLLATWGFVFGLGLGLVGVWLGSTVDWVVRACVLSWMMRKKLPGVS